MTAPFGIELSSTTAAAFVVIKLTRGNQLGSSFRCAIGSKPNAIGSETTDLKFGQFDLNIFERCWFQWAIGWAEAWTPNNQIVDLQKNNSAWCWTCGIVRYELTSSLIWREGTKRDQRFRKGAAGGLLRTVMERFKLPYKLLLTVHSRTFYDCLWRVGLLWVVAGKANWSFSWSVNLPSASKRRSIVSSVFL